MNPTLTHKTELTVTSCWCGIALAIPQILYAEAKRDHKHAVYCPLGHEFVFGGKTEAQKLQERLNEERDRSARLASQRDQAEASLRATKGVVTKLKKRGKAGVCPADGCHRHFEDLERHVASKHPGLAEA